jgi:hypothetical protein
MQGTVASKDLFHEGLVVFLGDFLVGNPGVILHYFGIGFFLDQQIGGIWLPAPKRPFNLTTRLSILHVRRTDR